VDLRRGGTKATSWTVADQMMQLKSALDPGRAVPHGATFSFLTIEYLPAAELPARHASPCSIAAFGLACAAFFFLVEFAAGRISFLHDGAIVAG
jgi:hypothetical protein